MSKAQYGEPLKWLNSVLLAETNDCIDWPFGITRKGYGYVRVGKNRIGAHRYVCLKAHGDAPSVLHTDAAHSCGNRKCCNKRHLRHATSLENSMDAMGHGTIRKGENCSKAKLTEKQVKEIKKNIGRQSLSSLARLYGVSVTAISFIRDGINWSSVIVA